jgi:hypothetical protein
MTWMWISAIAVLLGAELDAEMEHQTARDTTTGKPEPLGTRGARMADSVAFRGLEAHCEPRLQSFVVPAERRCPDGTRAPAGFQVDVRESP